MNNLWAEEKFLTIMWAEGYEKSNFFIFFACILYFSIKSTKYKQKKIKSYSSQSPQLTLLLKHCWFLRIATWINCIIYLPVSDCCKHNRQNICLSVQIFFRVLGEECISFSTVPLHIFTSITFPLCLSQWWISLLIKSTKS